MHDPEKPDDDEPLDSLVEREDEELERVADAAFEELERRWEYLGDAYPFSVDGALRADVHAAASPYVFLTALTHFGLQTDVAPESAASLFELVSEAALVEYLGGASAQSYPFGFPRRDSPRAFRDAVNDLCRELGEGVECGVSRAQTANAKDAKLDLVVWVPFGDDRQNQLSVFGQCATGADWRDKINELQPVDFCKTWLREQPAMTPLVAFFVPRQIEERYWYQVSASDRRILFDRLRIARSLRGLNEELAGRCAAWTESVIS